MFKEIEVVWGNETYVIPPKGVLKAIAVVEEHLTLNDLAISSQTGDVKLTQLSMAFGALLRHCGSRITDDEIYLSLFRGDDETIRERMITSIQMLMTLMVPPQEEVAAVAGKQQRRARATGKASRRSIKPLLAEDG
jgi:hypothetical protein